MSIRESLDPRDAQYIALVQGRAAGHSDDEIAAGLGVDDPRDLYRQLAEDGFPVCGCGELRPAPNHTCEVRKEWQNYRRKLYTGGAMLHQLQVLPSLADAWLDELQWVGIRADGWKEPDQWALPPQWTLPPEDRRGLHSVPVKLDNGQQVILAVAAMPEDPRNDGREFLRTEVRSVTPRARRAIIAAVTVMEGVELPKKHEARQEALQRVSL